MNALGSWRRVSLAVVVLLVGSTVASGGVVVGSSSLFDTLQYSDSFTLTANGGIQGRVVNAYPVNSPGTNVEVQDPERSARE